MGSRLDKAEAGQGITGEQAFVPETDEAVGHLVGVEAQVFGPELLRRPPVADADIDQNALAGEGVEYAVCGHGWGLLSCGLGVHFDVKTFLGKLKYRLEI